MVTIDVWPENGSPISWSSKPVDLVCRRQALADGEHRKRKTKQGESPNDGLRALCIGETLDSQEQKHAVGKIFATRNQSGVAIGRKIESQLEHHRDSEHDCRCIERIGLDIDFTDNQLTSGSSQEEQRQGCFQNGNRTLLHDTKREYCEKQQYADAA